MKIVDKTVRKQPKKVSIHAVEMGHTYRIAGHMPDGPPELWFCYDTSRLTSLKWPDSYIDKLIDKYEFIEVECELHYLGDKSE